jgi:hypothetical protein
MSTADPGTFRGVHRRRSCARACAGAAIVLLSGHGPASSQGVGDALKRSDAVGALEDKATYKFTPTFYRTTNQPNAVDLNVRANLGPHAAWVGYYQRASEFSQLRLGYENTIDLPFGHITPSLQYATRGFLGGSLTLEAGERYFGLLGIGRTNVRDYFNLNYDPNDTILIGVGTRALPKTTLSLFQIRDDRLGTGQHVIHLVARIKPDERTRWTFDVFHKEGRESADDELVVRGTGATVTYDFDRYFARIASDPHVNFSREHMLRLALGVRF